MQYKHLAVHSNAAQKCIIAAVMQVPLSHQCVSHFGSTWHCGKHLITLQLVMLTATPEIRNSVHSGTRHQADIDRTASTSSNSLFAGLHSRLRPFDLQFSIISAIQLLFVLVTRRGQFDLHLISFSSAGSTLNSFKISSLHLL